MLNLFAASSVPTAGLHTKLKVSRSEDVTAHHDKDASQLEYERGLLDHQLKLARRQIEELQAQLAEARASSAGEEAADSFPSNLLEQQYSTHSASAFGTSVPSSIVSGGGRNLHTPVHFESFPSFRRTPSIAGSDRMGNSQGNNIMGSVPPSPGGSLNQPSPFNSVLSIPGGTYLGHGNAPPNRSSSYANLAGAASARQSFPPASPHLRPPAHAPIPALHSHFNYGIPQPGEDLTSMLSEPGEDLPDRSDIDALDVYASELGLDSVTEQGQVEMLQAEVDRLTSRLQLEDAGKLELQRRVRELEDENGGLRRQVEVLRGRLRGGEGAKSRLSME